MRGMEPIEKTRVVTRDGDRQIEREDALAVEEPLEIRVGYGPTRARTRDGRQLGRAHRGDAVEDRAAE